MLKVLHFVHWPRSGITSLLKSMIPHFSPERFAHYYLLLEGDAEDTAEFRDISAQTYSISPNCGAFERMKAVRRIIAEVAPDIIHTHSFQPSLWASLFKGEAAVVRTIHNDYPYFHDGDAGSRIKRALEGLCLGSPTKAVVSVSASVQANLPWRLAEQKLTTIENGIDIDRLLTGDGGPDKQEALGIGENTFVFTSLGRLEHQKGFDVLVEAAAALRQRCEENFHLVLIGEGSQRSALEALIDKHQLGNQVTLAGYNPKPHQLLRLSDCYVSSSRYEGFGLSITEAMAVGLPLITTTVAGVAEMLTHGANAYKLADLSPDALAQAMLELMQDRALRDTIGRAGVEFVRAHFDISHMVEAYSRTYCDLVGQPLPTPAR